MHYLLLHQYTAHWLLLYYGIILLLSNAIVGFYFFYDVAIEPFWQEVGVESDTQVTVKACGPLVVYVMSFYHVYVW